VETVVFGRYRLDEQIGAGGMGVVWRSTDQLLQQTVALKRVSFAALGADQAQLTRDRALREARLAAQLRGHPHVVAVYDVLVDNSDIWLVMEYLPAHSLADIVKTDGPLGAGEAAKIGADIADALAAGHALGIEHRDVTPGNVLIGADGTVKLTDYGISHLAGDPRLTQTGITGTPAYMAPELASRGESTPASDVFSLGSTLYFALEAQPPFGTDDNVHKMLNVVGSGTIRQPTCAGPLEPLLLRLLTLDPSTRPDAATARDMLTQLATPDTRSIEQRAVSRPPPPPGKRRRLRQRTAIGAGVLLTVAAVVGAVSQLPHHTAAPQPISPAPLDDPDTRDRNADPCPLIDLGSLRKFGQATFATPPDLQTCQATIKASSGDNIVLRARFTSPDAGVADVNKNPQRIGDVVTYRQGLLKDPDGRPYCKAILVLASDSTIVITTRTDGGEPVDLCAVNEVATVNADAELLRHPGITHTPNRTAAYSFARSDACAMLDNTALRKVPNLNPDLVNHGYATWTCFWGQDPGTTTELRFLLLGSEPSGLGDPTTPIAGKSAFRNSYKAGCEATVVHRVVPGTDVREAFKVVVDLPDTPPATPGPGMRARHRPRRPHRATPTQDLTRSAMAPLTSGRWNRH
jgi:serine/threonine protein kinase